MVTSSVVDYLSRVLFPNFFKCFCMNNSARQNCPSDVDFLFLWFSCFLTKQLHGNMMLQKWNLTIWLFVELNREEISVILHLEAQMVVWQWLVRHEMEIL